MRIRVAAVGKGMPAWVAQGYQEYAKRLPRQCRLELHEIRSGTRGKVGDPAKARAEEGEQLLNAGSGSIVIALDESGQQWNTLELADRMRNWMDEGGEVTLLVGGAEGLAPECRNRSRSVWSLSRLTLPHMLVRVVLAEQIYRAWSVISGHPYHRG